MAGPRQLRMPAARLAG